MNGCKRWIVAFFPLLMTVVVCAASGVSAAPLMVEKNIFAPDRKPPAPDAPSANQGPNKPGLSPKAVQLDGIMGVGETRKAIIRAKVPMAGPPKGKDQSPYTTVQEGDAVGEYRVVKIEPKSIFLEKDGQTIVVGIFAEGKVVPPLPPVPAVSIPHSDGSSPAPGGQAMVAPGGRVKVRGPVPSSGAGGMPGEQGQPDSMGTVQVPSPPGGGGEMLQAGPGGEPMPDEGEDVGGEDEGGE